VVSAADQFKDVASFFIRVEVRILPLEPNSGSCQSLPFCAS